MTVARQVFVISDLHVGGAYPDEEAPLEERKRGFRMMTRVKELAEFVDLLAALPAARDVELVINGDFIDFLAEEEGAGRDIDPEKAPQWTPFRAKREEALDAFRGVIKRDQSLFTALRELLRAGKALTIVIGNHDIELSLPDVRAELERELGRGRLRFLDDGRALDLGEVLVDHGNLFDPANVVDHDRLRGLRAAYSRGWYEELDRAFSPPAGSKLVAEVMNPIKVAYGFIDLLKPESESLIALLLAIEPGYRNSLEGVAQALASAARSYVPRRGVPWILRNVSDSVSTPDGQLTDVAAGGAAEASELDALVAEVLVENPEAVVALRTAGVAAAVQQLEVAGGWRAKWSLFRLLVSEEEGDLASRIPQVQGTLRALADDYSFDRKRENDRYLDAAAWLASQGQNQKGYKVVIFGHTHHAKDIELEEVGARYMNTGTWANLMKFPAALTDSSLSADAVAAAFQAFATDLQANKLESYLVFEPTYVRLDLDENDRLLGAELRTYDWQNKAL
jgi:UDP-2,3-diacylglucosamine pyrophosphatase LpxH